MAARIDYSDTTPKSYYFTHDANFNVTAAFAAGEQAAERYHYAPYGQVVFLDHDYQPLATQASAIGNDYLYTGRQLDPETGLYDYRARYYHATPLAAAPAP